MQETYSKRKIIIASAVGILGLVALIFYFFGLREPSAPESSAEPNLSSNVEIGSPEVNPLGKTNPFSDIKTNPFE